MSTTKTVLVVDDEPDEIAFVEAVLTEIGGCTACSATTGESGLAKVREAKPDLIVLDVQMPGKSGFDVFDELKRDPATSDIPIIMLTGVAEKRGIRFSGNAMGEFFGREPEAYLEKPVEPADLKETVTEILGL